MSSGVWKHTQNAFKLQCLLHQRGYTHTGVWMSERVHKLHYSLVKKVRCSSYVVKEGLEVLQPTKVVAPAHSTLWDVITLWSWTGLVWNVDLSETHSPSHCQQHAQPHCMKHLCHSQSAVKEGDPSYFARHSLSATTFRELFMTKVGVVTEQWSLLLKLSWPGTTGVLQWWSSRDLKKCWIIMDPSDIVQLIGGVSIVSFIFPLLPADTRNWI